MAFTEAQLQTEINSDTGGAGLRILRFDNTSSSGYTDVTLQNLNSTSRKTGTVQVAQTNTAAQALAAIKVGLSA
jgi:hypothetical protein